MVLPKLVVFDLDATLWTPELFTLRGPAPRLGVDVELMCDVRDVIESLSQRNIRVGIASRTRKIEWARALLKEINVGSTTLHDLCKSLVEIFPGEKVAHFENLRRTSGVAFDDMIFFDDALDGAYGNCERVAELGVLAVHTPDGLTKERWNAGLEAYAAGRRGCVVSASFSSLPFACFSSVLPYASLLLNGLKKIETRNSSIFSNYENKTLAVRIGYKDLTETTRWRSFLLDRDDDEAKIKVGFRKCCVAGLVRIGKTVPTSTLASEIGWPQVEKLALTPRAECAEFATCLSDPRWLKRPVRALGKPSISHITLPLDALPDDRCEH